MQLPRHTILIAALLGGATLLGGVAIAGGWGPHRGPMGASLLESFDTNDDDVLETQFRLHLHRGIGYLAGNPGLRNIASLMHQAVPAA